MCELLWSDPQPQCGRSPSKRGVGCQFGPDVTKRFLQKNKLDYIIRSHEVKNDGYELAHDDKCITVFSAPNYWWVCHAFDLLLPLDWKVNACNQEYGMHVNIIFIQVHCYFFSVIQWATKVPLLHWQLQIWNQNSRHTKLLWVMSVWNSYVNYLYYQGSHSTWKTWKNESTPGNIREFWKI